MGHPRVRWGAHVWHTNSIKPAVLVYFSLLWSIHKLSTTMAWPSTPLYSPHFLDAPASPLFWYLSYPPMAFFRALKAAHPSSPWEHWSPLNTLFTSSFIPATGVHLVPAARTCYWKNMYWLWQLRTSTFGEVSSQVSIMCVGRTLNLIT